MKFARMFKLAAYLTLLLVPPRASAQTVVNPQLVEFDPSPDHSVQFVDASGNTIDVVGSYSFVARPNTTGATITINLFKPTPNGLGKITVNISQQLSAMTPGVVYTAIVSAIGPGGSSPSAPSNPFVLGGTAAPVPRAPSNVVLKRISS